MGTPDPVADPQGYQQALLSFLGDDDPAVAQAAAPAALREIVERAGADLRTRPRRVVWRWRPWRTSCTPDGLLDATAGCCARRAAAIGYDRICGWIACTQATAARGAAGCLRPSPRNLDLWAVPPTTSAPARHAERGPSFDLSFRLIAGHDRLHGGQARRAFDLVGPRRHKRRRPRPG
jgi:hypothetical protein